MKKFVSIFSLLIFISGASAQVLKPVKWTAEYKKTADCEYEIILKASIDKGWHLYSSFLDPNIGPVPTTVEMKTDANSSFIAKLSESAPIKEVEAVWDNKEVAFFANSAWFKRKVKLKNGNASTITINVNWMVCNDGTCLPPDDKELILTIPTDPNCNTAKLEGTKTGQIDPKNNLPEIKTIPEIKSTTTINTADTTVKIKPTITKTDTAKTEKAIAPISKNIESGSQTSQSGWGYFSGGFLAGLLALLTPCVFPMIPMTVSFFLKQSKSKAAGKRNALFYALSIILIYTGLGLLITSLFGGDALYNLSSSIWFNLAFFHHFSCICH
jgi:thiol:disulfide interchange protein